jgi:farnesyl-diphosphate farnesyltransferase
MKIQTWNRFAFSWMGQFSKKQGAYGKIPIHKESLLLQLLRVDEVTSAIWFLYVRPLRSNLQSDYVATKFRGLEDDLAFCDDMLPKVSRSFAAVIRQLPPALVVDIMIFYLVLRALDTVEDDMTAFESMTIKVQHLRQFHEQAFVDPKWSMDGVGQADERLLLQEFPKVHRLYAALPEASRLVISDITKRMADGMAEFVSKDLGQGTVDVPQYNLYCHYVAGLVGEGLSRLFAASGLEEASLASELHLSDQMGLFLQKTNIIRDYLEDYVDKRAFWPQSIWKKYSKTGELGYFTQDNEEAKGLALQCLNELVTDALELAPDCLAYMSRLHCDEVFRFCAIPQVMAIATLDKVYNNPDVFTGVVKIRKGLSCQLILRSNNMAELQETFHDFASSILRKTRAISAAQKTAVDPKLLNRTIQVCEKICSLTADAIVRRRRARLVAVPMYLALAIWIGWLLVEKTSSGQWHPGWEFAVRILWFLPLVVFYFHSGPRSSNASKSKSN